MSWLKRIAERLRAPALMQRMFAHVQIEEKIAEQENAPRVLQAAALRCLTCGELRACEKLLDETDTLETPPTYCRNADLILRLQKETHTRH